MTDRTTKALLFAVGVGLWMNVFKASTPLASVEAAQGTAQAVAFVDYWQLVQQQRDQKVPVDDIQVLLLAHIAANTRR